MIGFEIHRLALGVCQALGGCSFKVVHGWVGGWGSEPGPIFGPVTGFETRLAREVSSRFLLDVTLRPEPGDSFL